MYDALDGLGERWLSAPNEERSGVSHALTYRTPVELGTARLADGTEAHTLSGTPVDCVKFGVLHLLDAPPDLIVSGPNPGINVGVYVFYSGTVAAALEGAVLGVPAVAVSTSRRNAGRTDAVAQQAVRVIRLLLHRERPAGSAFNVNIPPLDGVEPEVAWTSQSLAFWGGRYQPAEGAAQARHYRLDPGADRADRHAPDSDVAALAAGRISVTPLRCDMTDRAALERLKGEAGQPGRNDSD